MSLLRQGGQAGRKPKAEGPPKEKARRKSAVQPTRAERSVPTDLIRRPYVRPARRHVGLVLLAALALVCFTYGYVFGTLAPYRMVQLGLPLLVLGGLMVWALPERGVAPVKAIERFFFATSISIPLWPNYLAIALPGLPWITVLRLVSFPLVFMLLLSISSSKAFRGSLKETLNGIPILWKLLAAFAIYQTLSMVLSNRPQISLNRLLIYQTSWTAMFFVAALVFTKPGRMERWALVMWVTGVVLSLVAIREYAVRQVLWAGTIPSFLAVQDDSVQRLLAAHMRAGTERYRTQATYSTALGLSEFLALMTPFALNYIGNGYRLIMRLLAAASLPLILTAIILTDSRLGMVGFLLACILYLFFWGALQWQQRRGSLIGPAIVMSYPALFTLFVSAVLFVPRIRLMTLGGGQHASSNDARVEQVHKGMPIVFRHPFGHGPGMGSPALNYTNPSGVNTIDTYWLSTALDYGIPGFLMFYGLFVVAVIFGFKAIVAGTRNREQGLLVPLVIAMVSYFIIKSIYAGTENQSLVYMMLGAIAALVYRQRMSSPAIVDTGDARSISRPMSGQA